MPILCAGHEKYRANLAGSENSHLTCIIAHCIHHHAIVRHKSNQFLRTAHHAAARSQKVLPAPLMLLVILLTDSSLGRPGKAYDQPHHARSSNCACITLRHCASFSTNLDPGQPSLGPVRMDQLLLLGTIN